MESVEDMVSRLDSMASGEPSWDLSNHDMLALQYALKFVPWSDYYKPPAAKNQGGPDSASTNSAMDAMQRLLAIWADGVSIVDALNQTKNLVSEYRASQHQ